MIIEPLIYHIFIPICRPIGLWNFWTYFKKNVATQAFFVLRTKQKVNSLAKSYMEALRNCKTSYQLSVLRTNHPPPLSIKMVRRGLCGLNPPTLGSQMFVFNFFGNKISLLPKVKLNVI